MPTALSPSGAEVTGIGFTDHRARFMYDPLGWVHWAFPWGEPGPLRDGVIEDWQCRRLQAIGDSVFEGHGKRSHITKVATASGHGPGKSAEAIMENLWWMSTRPEAKGYITANTGSQLDGKTWPELSKWLSLCKVKDWFDLTATKLSARDGLAGLSDASKRWFVTKLTWSEQRPTAAAGEHGPYPIITFDEASEIPKIIWETAQGALTTDHCLWLVAGNPTEPTGEFADIFGGRRRGWFTQSIDVRTMKRPTVNKEYLNELVEEWGEDHDYVRVRVRGLFPRTGFNQFIDDALLTEASERRYVDADLYGQSRYLGCDVAGEGDDRSVIIRRHGLWLPPECCDVFRGAKVYEVGDRLISIIEDYEPDGVFVDGIGIGKGVVDRLHERNVECINVGAAGSESRFRETMARKGVPYEFKGLAAMLWGGVRDWLRDGGSLFHAPRDLVEELRTRQYSIDQNTGLVALEPKKLMKMRGLPSPDHADALACTFAAAVRPKSRDPFAYLDYPEPEYDELGVA